MSCLSFENSSRCSATPTRNYSQDSFLSMRQMAELFKWYVSIMVNKYLKDIRRLKSIRKTNVSMTFGSLQNVISEQLKPLICNSRGDTEKSIVPVTFNKKYNSFETLTNCFRHCFCRWEKSIPFFPLSFECRKNHETVSQIQLLICVQINQSEIKLQLRRYIWVTNNVVCSF